MENTAQNAISLGCNSWLHLTIHELISRRLPVDHQGYLDRRVHRSLLSRAARVYFQRAREGTIVNGADVRDVSRAFCFASYFFPPYQARETTCRFTPAIMFARLRTSAGQARALIGSRAICRESSSRTRAPRNTRYRRAASTAMEKKRNRPGQRTTVASASGSFRLLSCSSRGCSRNASLRGRARRVRSRPAILTIQYWSTVYTVLWLSEYGYLPAISQCSLTCQFFRLNAILGLIMKCRLQES